MADTSPPPHLKFLFGGMSGCLSTSIIQPLDLVKSRMQLAREGGTRLYSSFGDAFMKISRSEGVGGMYKGLSAALFRQITYTTARMGIFNSLMTVTEQRQRTQLAASLPVGESPGAVVNVPVYQKFLLGMTAGGLAAIVGCPAEVALIRMTTDGRLPAAERRNYRHVFNAMRIVAREEGVLKWWRGVAPTMARAMILNAAQLGSYAQAKESLVKHTPLSDGLPLHAAASIISAFFATTFSLPPDALKTRLQANPGKFRSAFHALSSVVKQEGVLALWSGYLPYFLRLGPHTILTFIFLEQLNLVYKRSKQAN